VTGGAGCACEICAPDTVTLDAFDQLRVLAAFQVLSMPSGALGVKHKQARAVLRDLLGRAPKGRVPKGLDLDGYLAWAGAT